MLKGKYKCGASLITSNHVLTAAHCFDNSTKLQDLSVRCGDWDTSSDSELYPHQEMSAKSLIVHPGYDRQFFLQVTKTPQKDYFLQQRLQIKWHWIQSVLV